MDRWAHNAMMTGRHMFQISTPQLLVGEMVYYETHSLTAMTKTRGAVVGCREVY
jgi:hypothetical protein